MPLCRCCQTPSPIAGAASSTGHFPWRELGSGLGARPHSESKRGLCKPGAEPRLGGGWGRGTGPSLQAVEQRVGWIGRASLWRGAVGPDPGHLSAPRPKGWWQGRWGWGGVRRDGDDGALWVWRPQAWEGGGGWPCSGPSETSFQWGSALPWGRGRAVGCQAVNSSQASTIWGCGRG